MLYVNGLRDDIKRKCMFKFLLDCNFHTIVPQEFHSTTSIHLANGVVVVYGHTEVTQRFLH